MSTWSRRCRWVIAQLAWQEEQPDARVLQSAFAATLLSVVAAGALLGGAGTRPDRSPVLGVSIAVLVAAVLILRPSLIAQPTGCAVVPVLDILAIGLIAADPDLVSISPVAVLVSLWLGLQFGLRGAALAMAATVAFITLPGLMTGVATVERTIVVPLIAGIVPCAITFGVRSAQQAKDRAEAHRAELAEALQVIERNRRTAEAIFTTVDVGLALLDPDGRPMLMNERLGRMAELAFPEATDDLDDGWIFDESGVERLRFEETPIYRASAGVDVDDERVWVGDVPMGRRALSISARPVEAPDGTVAMTALSVADVTDYMRALQVKDEFVALVSHELRTPLTSIYGYVDVLLDDETLPARARAQLAVVFRNAERLDRLVDDLLEEVQHSTGQIRLERSDVDLAAIVHDGVAGALPSALEAGVTLAHDDAPGLVVHGDRQRLAQVLDNLVSNAIKYTPAGGRVDVELSTESAAAAESVPGWAIVRIRDTGIGIGSDDLDRLFTRFYRTREATDRAIRGVGLGLSITKAIVQRHGGRIDVESQLGRGSVFTVRLPMAAVESAEAPWSVRRRLRA